MTIKALSDIITVARAAAPPHGMITRILAIDGCGGAGKSTLAQRLATRIGAQIVPTDDFATPDIPLEWYQRLQDTVLTPLQSNRAGRYQRYDWTLGKLADWRDVPVQPWLILEGVSSTRALFRPALTVRLFVRAPRKIRLERGLQLDGQDAMAQWQAWQAEEDAYIASENPAAHADLVIDGTIALPD